MMFGGNFAPRNWAFCDGQLLQISQYTALFSLLGTTYGGDGRTTFALPELRGRAPMNAGNLNGSSPSFIRGAYGGVTDLTLSLQELPNHLHTGQSRINGKFTFNASSAAGDTNDPTGAYLTTVTDNLYTLDKSQEMGSELVDFTQNLNLSNKGGSQPHNNMQPYQVVNFVIALTGVYPSRS